MPCHSDRVRRNYITPSVTEMLPSQVTMEQIVQARFSELQIMAVARSPRAMRDLARMTADGVYLELIKGLAKRGGR